MITLRLSAAPPGYGGRSVRLLTRRVVEVGVLASISSHERVREEPKDSYLRTQGAVLCDTAAW